MTDLRKQIERLVSKKKQRLQALEAELASVIKDISRLKAHIEAHEETLRLLPRDLPGTKPGQMNLKKGSVMERTYTYLRGKGSPAHIKEILLGIGMEENQESIRTVSSQLNVYFKKERYFTRPLPNTFGLREFAPEDQEEESSNGEPDGGSA